MQKIQQGKFTIEYAASSSHRIIFETHEQRIEGIWAGYTVPATLDLHGTRYFHCTPYYDGKIWVDQVFAILGEVA